MHKILAHTQIIKKRVSQITRSIRSSARHWRKSSHSYRSLSPKLSGSENPKQSLKPLSRTLSMYLSRQLRQLAVLILL